MSLCFEGFLAFDLRPDTPSQIKDTLSYLTRSEEYALNEAPPHPFFEVPGWRQFLQIRSVDGGHPGLMWSHLAEVARPAPHGQTTPRLTLSFRRVMHDDIEFYELWRKFLSWIVPHIETDGFIGYYRETYSLHPVIVYSRDGHIFTGTPSSAPKGESGEAWPGNPKYILPRWPKNEGKGYSTP